MPHSIPQNLFVTGTDTGVGKTLVSAVLTAGLKAEYWKPVQSGLTDLTDLEWVKKKTGLPDTHFHRETYRLKTPLSPHASAAQEGVKIKMNAFNVPERRLSRHLIIEGAGGVMVPLNDSEFMVDLMYKIRAPVLLVASSGLGTINHTLLSLDQLRRKGLQVYGVVMNGPKNPSNREAVEHYGRVSVCAEIEPLEEINAGTLRQVFDRNFL
ncbi:MAG: dethiobiotin synthase [Pseudomonadota bacterium]